MQQEAIELQEGWYQGTKTEGEMDREGRYTNNGRTSKRRVQRIYSTAILSVGGMTSKGEERKSFESIAEKEIHTHPLELHQASLIRHFRFRYSSSLPFCTIP